MEVIGYARVSKKDQNLDLQMDALNQRGCTRIFADKLSGVKDRPELGEALRYVRPGDTLIVWKLDRLGRSLKELVQIVYDLGERNINFVSVQDNIDTSVPFGRFIFGVFAALAEYEREIVIERTTAGLMAARQRGRIGGRPRGLSKSSMIKAQTAAQMYQSRLSHNPPLTVEDIARTIGKTRKTVYHYLKMVGTPLDKDNGKIVRRPPKTMLPGGELSAI